MALRTYLGSTFKSLRVRDYRRYFVGQSVSVVGTWMQKVAQALLVLDLTDSAVMLGVTVALQQIPTLLLTPVGGVVADRFPRRNILLVTQAAAVLPALVLGILTLGGWVRIEIVLVLALTLGVIDAIDKPARLTFVSVLVEDHDLTNAVTLNNTVQNVGKVVGPALAGLAIDTVGLGWSFLANAASFVAVLVGLWLIRPIVHREHDARSGGRTGTVRESLRYVGGRRDLLAPMVLMTVSGLLAYNWQVVLPIFARDSFGGDAQAVGMMFTAMGVGAVVGGLSLAGSMRASTGVLTVTSVVFAALMLLASVAPTLVLAYVAMVLLGASSVSFRTLATSALQLAAEPAMRGRVVSLLILATNGTTPIGGPLMGWICETSSPRIALAVGGVGTALAALGARVHLGRGRVTEPRDVVDVT